MLITRRQFTRQTALATGALYPVLWANRAGGADSRVTRLGPIDASAIKKLASKISGQVITQDSPVYESARHVNNPAYDRHPVLIVRCGSTTDVARSLEFAQTQSLIVAVRSGGHSAAGFGVCDGGLVIDLGLMRRVEIDAHKNTVRAQAGCVIGDVDHTTQRLGLATVVGGCQTVGLGGLTLGGGVGTLMPKYGAACDNLESADIVTADGRQLTASASLNSDLFWAIRGGGGNFGIATSFEYRLHPVSDVLAGALEYPADHIPDLLHVYLDFTASAPDEVMLVSMIVPSPQAPRFRILFRHCGEPGPGNQLLKALQEPIKPQDDTIKIMPYLEAQRTEFPQPRKPLPYFATSVFLPELNEPAITAITTAVHDAPRHFRVMMWHFHGAVTRVPSSDMAFPLRRNGHELQLRADWDTPEEALSAVQWTKNLRAALLPFSHGLYVNSLSEPSDELIRTSYGCNYHRLTELKKKYDPTNVLGLNPNIKAV